MATFAQTAGSYPASLSFGGVTSNQVTVGQNFTVDVLFNTGGVASSGADVLVEYDPTQATFVSAVFPTVSGVYPLVVTPEPIQKTVGTKRVLEMARSQSGGGTATNGTGTFVKLTFTPLGAVGSTIALDFGFDGIGETIDSNITSATTVTDLLGTADSTTLTVVAATVTSDPSISSISPASGSKDISQNVTIFGSNFGATQGAGYVHLGTKSMTVVSWTDTQIVITVPAESDLTANSTRQVKVHKEDGKEANYIGYTYTVAPLPNSGPEEIMWASIVLAALGMSFLAYRKMNYASNIQTSMPVETFANIMSPQENSDEDSISYRF
jgi:hypothetical protein